MNYPKLIVKRENKILTIDWSSFSSDIYQLWIGTEPNNETKVLQIAEKQDFIKIKAEFPIYFFRVLLKNGTEFFTREDLVDLEGTVNFRDYGGWQGFDGKNVVFGKLYRSDVLSQLTSQDLEYIQNQLGIKTVIDYRNEIEREADPDKKWKGATFYSLDPNADMAAMASNTSEKSVATHQKHSFKEMLKTVEGRENIKNLKANMTEQYRQFVLSPQSLTVYRKVIQLHLKKENTPILQHCKGGKDRTGFGVAILLLLLGVSEKDVATDFFLTDEYRKEHIASRMELYRKYTTDEEVLDNLRALTSSEPEYLAATFETIKETYGSFDQFVQEGLNISQQEIETLRSLYLV